MATNKEVKPHIYLGATGKASPYTSPQTGGGDKPEIPPRNRAEHHAHLLGQLREIESSQVVLQQEAEDFELEARLGIQVEFESFPGVHLAIDSLADAAQKIELLNVTEWNNRVIATVFVPQGKLSVFEKKLQAYLQSRTDRNGKPRDHRGLVDAIQSFRHAALESLWSDERTLLPNDADTVIWWEVWLSVRGNRQAVLHDFRLLATAAEMQVAETALEFPERTVLLAKGSRRQLTRSGLLLNNVAELRLAKETAGFFDGLLPEEQQDWAAELLERLELPRDPDQSPVVCLLDTGTNIGHPLLAAFISANDQYAVEPSWTPNDDHGHGSGMAGLAALGDLSEVLTHGDPVAVEHRLESVKLLRHSGDNEGKHLGILTASGVSLPEITNPWRKRAFAMALSATDTRDRGRPSAWSATVDSLAADCIGHSEQPRLFTICAGNILQDPSLLSPYPAHNELQDVHDPGQAWNALTVGAYTTKDQIVGADYGAYDAVAPAGGISPFSSTSVAWSKHAPVKPEVMFEGGNLGDDGVIVTKIPSLSLLTTHHKPLDRLLTTF